MNTSSRLVALATLVLAPVALGADRPCTKTDAAAAEKAIDRVVSWPQLEKAWVDYRHCDAGSVDDLYTDALLRLAVEWKNVDMLAAAVRKDPQYRDFVYRHLKSSASSKEDRAAVYSRAKASCPATLDAFCAELADVVNSDK